MRPREDVPVDEDGIPILKDVIEAPAETESEADPQPATPPPASSIQGLSEELRDSPSLRKALDEFAAELSLSIYQHIDRSIRPAIQELVTRAVDEVGSQTFDGIREQLEARIPDILARFLEEANAPGE
jgi:hypothetical protein